MNRDLNKSEGQKMEWIFIQLENTHDTPLFKKHNCSYMSKTRDYFTASSRHRMVKNLINFETYP